MQEPPAPREPRAQSIRRPWRRRRQRGYAASDRLSDALGYPELHDRFQPPPLGSLDRREFDQMPKHLLDEERVALGVTLERMREVGGRCALEPRRDDRRDIFA